MVPSHLSTRRVAVIDSSQEPQDLIPAVGVDQVSHEDRFHDIDHIAEPNSLPRLNTI